MAAARAAPAALTMNTVISHFVITFLSPLLFGGVNKSTSPDPLSPREGLTSETTRRGYDENVYTRMRQ